jgi:hypothetical protein
MLVADGWEWRRDPRQDRWRAMQDDTREPGRNREDRDPRPPDRPLPRSSSWGRAA